MTDRQILELLHREVKPALGCTEPIAVVLMVAGDAAAQRLLRCRKLFPRLNRKRR